MIQRILSLILMWCVLPALMFSVPCHAQEFNDIRVQHLQGLPTPVHHGYYEHRFRVSNSGSKVRNVRLTIYGGSGFDQALGSLSRSVAVAPLASVEVSLFQPCLSSLDSKLEIRVDSVRVSGEDLGIRLRGTYFTALYHFTGIQATVMVSKSVPGNIINFSNKKGGLFASSSDLSYAYADIPVELWSGNWLTYSAYDAIMLTPGDISLMRPHTIAALDEYVRLGGNLVICGGNAPEGAIALTGQVKRLDSGFGIKLYLPENPENLDEESWKSCSSIFVATSKILREGLGRYSNASETNSAFPVIDKDSSPIRAFFVLLLIFAIVIGPLNLWVLNRKKKRIWILWTTPLISLFFSLLVVGYSFIAEGVASKVNIASFTFLDENARIASTLGVIGYYCPIPPSRLEFGIYTEVQKYVVEYSDSTNYNVDWTSGQRLTGGWIKSRVVTHLMSRTSEMRRERINIVSASPERVEIVNGLGAAIKDIDLCMPDGRIYKYRNTIAPGAKATLNFASSEDIHGRSQGLRDGLRDGIFDKQWLSNRFSNVYSLHLTPGSYVARLESSPFINPGMKPGELKQTAAVYGILAVDGGAK
ncbi:MAG: hypothetical protein JXR78_11555 [Victivallales bacterium]|nr:hypothetical protein [Victivallales bacterium]